MNITVNLFGRDVARVVIDITPLITLLTPAAQTAPTNGHRVADQLVGRTMQMVGRHMTHT